MTPVTWRHEVHGTAIWTFKCRKPLSASANRGQSQAMPGWRLSRPECKNPRPDHWRGVFLYNSLTITYFHTGCSTIIGAKSFHGPVRDGKGWDRLAMVIRHDLYRPQLSMEQLRS